MVAAMAEQARPRAKSSRPSQIESLKLKMAALEARIGKVEASRPAVWPFTIVDDEAEADDAKWQELPDSVTIEMLNAGWREKAIWYGLDPDNLKNPGFEGLLKDYADDSIDAVEIVKNARI